MKLLNRRESCRGLYCSCKEERAGEKTAREIIVIVTRVISGAVKRTLLILLCASHL